MTTVALAVKQRPGDAVGMAIACHVSRSYVPLGISRTAAEHRMLTNTSRSLGG